MIKKSLLFLAAAAVAFGVNAEPLTPQQALERAGSVEAGGRKLKPSGQPTLSFTAKTMKGEPAVYVFNNTDKRGFLLLSADDIAVPVLGYTDSGNFDPNNIPPQMQYWLDEYAAQIEYAKSINLETKDMGSLNFPSSWTPIAPLIKSKWGQSAPFNQETPVIGNSQCPTGCVATAMAQVMNYWQYPEIGDGRITYSYQYSNTETKTNSMYFDQQPFEWENMLLNYEKGTYTEAQAAAVAYLMKACGYSVQMNYYPTFSGTQSEYVATALVDNFKYNPGTNSVQRLAYNASEWNELVYTQLQNGPIIYSGISSLGGHCFVVDGYDGNGYFHFNWGWTGMCDGYYQLSALNPTQQGTGGFYGGYNFDQSIITDVKKPTGEPTQEVEPLMSIIGSLKATATNSTLNFSIEDAASPSIANFSIYSIRPTFGTEITNIDGSGEPIYIQAASNINTTFRPGTFYSIKEQKGFYMRVLMSSTLADGTYKVRLVWKTSANSNDWKYFSIAPQNYDYVYVTKSGNSYTVENLDVKKYSITEAKITTPLFYNNPFEIQMTMENPNDVELSQSVVPCLYLDGKKQYSGESWTLTLMPNQTQTVTMNCTFQRENNGSTPTTGNPIDFDLVLEDQVSGTPYGNYGKVTMKRSSASASLRLNEISIDNAVESGPLGDLAFVYGIRNIYNIGLSVTVAASGGFVASPLTAVIKEYDSETSTALGTVYEKDFENMVYLESGNSASESTILKYEDFDVSKIYQVSVWYSRNNTRVQLGAVLVAASSGVQEVLAGGEGVALVYAGNLVKAVSNSNVISLEVYDSAGHLVRSINGDETNIQDLASGIYVVRAVDATGHTSTLKIAK